MNQTSWNLSRHMRRIIQSIFNEICIFNWCSNMCAWDISPWYLRNHTKLKSFVLASVAASNLRIEPIHFARSSQTKIVGMRYANGFLN